MPEVLHKYWADVVEHVHALGFAEGAIVAKPEFEPHLSLAGTYDRFPAIDKVDVLIIHKGLIVEIPPQRLGEAIDALAVTFANEVFIVLARGGPVISFDSKHLSGWSKVLDHAFEPEENPDYELQLHKDSAGRMPATYVGDGRVLLETVYHHLMVVPGADISILPHLIRDGYFDEALTSVINGMLRPGMTFVDIGANFGTYTVIGAQIVGPQGRVVAIEPVPPIGQMLFETVAMNGFDDRCEVLRVAAGAEDGTATIFGFGSRQGGNTLLEHIADDARDKLGQEVTQHEVPVRTLDGIVEELELTRIDFMKIDVEGFEQQVLKGGRKTIQSMRPTLLLEWHACFFDERGNDPRAYYDVLTEDLGYELFRVESGGKIRKAKFDRLVSSPFSDILAKPKD
ncbi:FkbM family methyltransferase [Pontixanthobacter aquaemixtae]|uniref:FkbM family methyltransferase n=1 Tax=Pontixanthobacter aquaemixtae TaxID=1958940 RepID=A0A844ZS19_9SPHN|nr:FkbM family methyltransferase [Pontixanthobacter aquaemixtae]MXO90663.1 FkbM family methyltransferase [Pontixanthobacter aquaemixtae]